MTTPILMGMEVEAAIPVVLPEEVATAMRQVTTSHYSHYALLPEYSVWSSCITGNDNDPPPGVVQFNSLVDDKYRIPRGWYKWTDSSAGIEMKFDGPTDSLEEGLLRVRRLSDWLSDYGIRGFYNAGTHIHLGIGKWLDTLAPITDSAKSTLRSLLYGFFVSRERALMRLVPVERHTSGYCKRVFASGSNIGPAEIINVTNVTPAWSIHNTFLNYAASPIGRLGMYSITNYRNFPTFEFRLFPGTGYRIALEGYLRLCHHLFQLGSKRVLDPKYLKPLASGEDTFIVNPYTYTVNDLSSEVEDPWLKAWIKKTIENDGNPIKSLEYTDAIEPTAVATI